MFLLCSCCYLGGKLDQLPFIHAQRTLVNYRLVLTEILAELYDSTEGVNREVYLAVDVSKIG